MLKDKLILPRLYRFMSQTDKAIHQKGSFYKLVSGVISGVSLTAIMPTVAALQSGMPQWGLSYKAWIVFLAVLALCGAVASVEGTKLSYISGLGYMRNLQIMIGNKVSRLPLGWFDSQSAGRLSRMVTNEMMSTGQVAAYFIGSLLHNASACIIFCLGCWIWNWQLGLLLSVGVPIVFLLMHVGQACVFRMSRLENKGEELIAARIVEFAQCQGALRACNASSSYPELRDSFSKSKTCLTKGLWWGVAGNFLSGMGVQMLTVLGIVVICQMGLAGTMSPLETLIMIGVILRFSALLTEVAGLLFGLEERRMMLNSIDEVMDTPEMPVCEQSAELPSDNSIELKNIAFSYIEGQPVIRNVSVTAPASKMIAIVGPSGCGKTTLIKLIARFYDVDAGQITIGGADIRNLSTQHLFEQVSFVFQDVYLFNDTLRNNVLIARPNAGEAELTRVAELAGMTEIIERLPEGWETPCGEGGRSLSGGERQRVSIARALLKQAPIVLFDEATSALDAENEANIVRSMEELRQHSTLIVVAHKLETIKMADQIVVMNADGELAEVGTHEELLAKNGSYGDFWNKRCLSAQWSLI